MSIDTPSGKKNLDFRSPLFTEFQVGFCAVFCKFPKNCFLQLRSSGGSFSSVISDVNLMEGITITYKCK